VGRRWALPGLLLAAWIAVPALFVNSGESALRIHSGSRTLEGAFRLQIAASNSLTYLVQASTNLQDWMSLSTNVATEPLAEFVDPAASTYRHRFYRLAAGSGGLVLSRSSAKPGETLELLGGPFYPDAPASVLFLGPAGTEIRVLPFTVTTGTAAVVVPVMVHADPPVLRGGSVTVSLRQEVADGVHLLTSAQPLRIGDLPTTGLGAGAVTLEYLNQVSNLLARASGRWQTIETASQGRVDASSLRLNLLALQTNVVGARSEIERIVSGQASRISLGRIRDREVLLDIDAVVLIDRMLAAALLSARPATLSGTRALSGVAAETTETSEILASIGETLNPGPGESFRTVFDVFERVNSVGGMGVGILATAAVVLSVASAPVAAAIASTAGAVLFFSTCIAPAVMGVSALSFAAPFIEAQTGRQVSLEDYRPALNHIQKGSQAYLVDELEGRVLEGVFRAHGADEDLVARTTIFLNTSKSILANQDLTQPQSVTSLAFANSEVIFAGLSQPGGEPATYIGRIEDTFAEGYDIAGWENTISAIVTINLSGQGTAASPFTGTLQCYGNVVTKLLYCYSVDPPCDPGGLSMLRLEDGKVSGASGLVTAGGTVTLSNEAAGTIPIPLQFSGGIIGDDPVTGRTTLTGTLVLVNFKEWTVSLTKD
jgi:hypothetical protein